LWARAHSRFLRPQVADEGALITISGMKGDCAVLGKFNVCNTESALATDEYLPQFLVNNKKDVLINKF